MILKNSAFKTVTCSSGHLSLFTSKTEKLTLFGYIWELYAYFFSYLSLADRAVVLEWYLDALMETCFLIYLMQNMKMELRTEHAWDGLPMSHNPVTIALKSYDTGMLMQVSAPFFNDPPALVVTFLQETEGLQM